MSTPLKILQKYWKHSEFRNSQEAIIQTVLSSKDVIAFLPTGGGKSLCFQIPALINEGICIVISPLVALMQDQVSSLLEKEIKAVALTSSLSRNEIVIIFDNLQFGNYKFLYLSPERLSSEFIQEKISQLNVNLLAIDEAHCISEWGHDFRPSYRNIQVLKQLHPTIPTIALTASATRVVLKDIEENLQLTDAITYKTSLKREKLAYKLYKTEDVRFALKQLLTKNKNPAIIYTSSRKATKNISLFLNSNGFKSTFYHGGLTANDKKEAYHNWLNEITPIMVATNAFGMGIDKDNVSTIIHTNLPYSIENYLQEAGRAGRNGVAAESVIIYNEAILFNFKNRFEQGQTSVDFIKDVYLKLNQHFQISYGEKPLIPFSFNFQEFCQKYELPKLKINNAIQQLHNQQIIQLDEHYHRKSQLTFTVSHKALMRYSDKNEQRGNLIKLLLRSYGGIFNDSKKIDEYQLAQKLGFNSSQIIKQLKGIEDDGFINYDSVTADSFIQFMVPREDHRTINSVANNIKRHQKIKLDKAKAVIKYMTNTKQCRSCLLLSYFNEYDTETCGICDLCLKTNADTQTVEGIASSILQLLDQDVKLTSREIVDQLDIEKSSVISTLQLLLDTNKIAITSQHKFELKKYE